MAEQIPYTRAARSYRAEGTGDSGWILMPAADAPAALHLLSGRGRWEYSADTPAALAGDTAAATPDHRGTLDAPAARTAYPLPVAVRFVDQAGGSSRWVVQINERSGPR